MIYNLRLSATHASALARALPDAQCGRACALIAIYNTSAFLAGGQCFGPFMAHNLTPNSRVCLRG